MNYAEIIWGRHVHYKCHCEVQCFGWTEYILPACSVYFVVSLSVFVYKNLLHYYSLAVGCVKQNDNAISKQCITRYASEVTQAHMGNK